MEELNLFVKSIFIDNMIFAYFLGMCSFLAVSKNVKTALGLGIAVTFMLVVTLPINYLLNKYVLQEGALTWLSPELAGVDLSFLGLILFIAVIASATQLVEMAVEKFSPSLYASLGIFLPLIAVNCAILGASLFMQQRDFGSALSATADSHHGHRRHPRETRLQRHPQTIARRGHRIHHHRSHGHRLHEFHGH